jgi:opacity protein-like surface antigen
MGGEVLSMPLHDVCRFGARLLAAGFVAGAMLVGGQLRAEPSKLPPEVGYNYSELELPRTAAMGGALRAFSNSLEALQNNPANLAATRVYHIGGGAQFWTDANRQSYGVSIVDSVVSRSHLAGGVSANWLFQDPDGVDRHDLDARLGFALPVSDKLLVGASLHYLDLSEEGYPRGRAVVPPSVASSGLDGESIVKDITFDAGISIRPASGLALSLVGQNLTDPGHGFLPLLFGGGVGYGTSLFTAEVDLVADFTTYEDTSLRGMAGLEFLAGGQYPIRLGYRYDDGQGTHALSGGLGYVAREFAFDVSLRRVLGDEATTAFFIGLKYHVESLGIAADE